MHSIGNTERGHHTEMSTKRKRPHNMKTKGGRVTPRQEQARVVEATRQATMASLGRSVSNRLKRNKR